MTPQIYTQENLQLSVGIMVGNRQYWNIYIYDYFWDVHVVKWVWDSVLKIEALFVWEHPMKSAPLIHSALIFSWFTHKRSHTKLMSRSLKYRANFLIPHFDHYAPHWYLFHFFSIWRKNNLMQSSNITTSHTPII